MSAVPSGFGIADRLQIDSFEATGSIDGAAKVTVLEDGTLCCRLRPPRDRGVKYISDYRAGWAAGKQNREWTFTSQAAADGYNDAIWDRMKWHLAYCSGHGVDTGCRKAG